MKVLLKYFYITFLVLVAFSCDFEPNSEVFTQIDKPSVAGLSINLNNSDEVIQLKQETTFEYTVQTGGKDLIESRAILNGEIVWVTSFPSGAFTLNPVTLGTGTHTLKIEFIAEPESGSLADKYGAETLYVWIERTIVVDLTIPNDPTDPSAIKILSVVNVNSTIKVTWSKYDNANFEKYELIREDYQANGYTVGGVVLESGLSTDTVYNDRSYVGGKSEYRIKLYAAGQTYTSPVFTYEHPYKPNVQQKINDDGSVTISWNSLSQISNNFLRYTLKVKKWVGGYSQTTTYIREAVMDTAITFPQSDLRFGSVRDMEFSLTAYAYLHSYPFIHYAKLKYGDLFPEFQPIYYSDSHINNTYFNLNVEPQFNEEAQAFFVTKNNLLYKISESGELLDSLNTQYPYICLNKNMGVASSSNFKHVKINIETMTVESLPSLPDGNVLGLSEDDKLLFRSESIGIKVYDLQSNIELPFVNQSGIGPRAISPDGNWLLVPGIKKLIGDHYESWAGWPNAGYRSAGFVDGTLTAIFGFNDRVEKKSLETGSNLLVSYNYTGPCNIDKISGLIGCLTGNQFIILNDNFELQKSLPVDIDAGSFYLINNTVLCTSGTQIKLSDIP